MALLACNECGGAVSSSAPSCPHCGYRTASAATAPSGHSPPKPVVRADPLLTDAQTITMAVLVGVFLGALALAAWTRFGSILLVVTVAGVAIASAYSTKLPPVVAPPLRWLYVDLRRLMVLVLTVIGGAGLGYATRIPKMDRCAVATREVEAQPPANATPAQLASFYSEAVRRANEGATACWSVGDSDAVTKIVAARDSLAKFRDGSFESLEKAEAVAAAAANQENARTAAAKKQADDKAFAAKQTAAEAAWPKTKIEIAKLLGAAGQKMAQRDWEGAAVAVEAANGLLRDVVGTTADDGADFDQLAKRTEKLDEQIAPRLQAAAEEKRILSSVDVVVDAAVMAADFAANSATAMRKYENRKLLVSGVSEGVSTNVDGDFFTALGTYPAIRAFFVSRGAAAEVQPGQRIRLICQRVGSGVFIDLAECRAVQPKPN